MADRYPTAPAQDGCKEYKALSRRHFLGLSAATLVTALGPAWLPRVVLADEDDSERDVLVSIFLRGGADSLSLCVPFAEADYYKLRPTLALPRPDSGSPFAVSDLDGFFGLSPALMALLEPYQAGDLLFVHACGSNDPTRSHFDAMYFMEVGQPQPPASLATGWLGRHLQTTAPTLQDGLIRAVGINHSLQRTLIGGPRSVAAPEPAKYGLDGDPDSSAERLAAIEVMYAASEDPLRLNANNTIQTIELLQRIGFDSYQPAGGASYPEDEFGQALRATAALIKAQVGVEAIAIDLGGWDTHEMQEPQEGSMALVMRNLAEGLAAFYRDLEGDSVGNVITTTMSEFGRNAIENGSLGTDHGHGGLMMVLGKSVAGGRVLTRWPGLAPDQLYEGQDLKVTIDYRDVLTEIVTKRLRNPDFRNVFPDANYQPIDHGVIAG